MMQPFDYTARLDALRAAAGRRGADHVVISGASNLAYFAGLRILNMSRPIFMVLTPQRTVLIVPALEGEHSDRAGSADEVVVYYEQPDRADSPHDPFAVLGGLLPAGGACVGLDVSGATAAAYRHLLGVADEVIDISPAIGQLRIVKEAAELDRLRLSAELVNHGLAVSLAAIADGIDQVVVEERGSSAILERAAEIAPGVDVTLRRFTTSGTDSSLPHLITTTRVIRAGESGIHNRHVAAEGYMAELERSFLVGEVSGRARDHFRLAEEAQLAGIAAVAPGVAMRDVDAACRRVFAAAGVEERAIHRSGHGLGLDVHEAPYLRWDHDDELRPGMVISVEPGIYFPGEHGFRHSDTVLVTETGHEVLTSAVRGLDALTLGAA